jgi:hypothetical protein
VNLLQQYTHSVAWGLDGNTEATEIFVLVFPHGIQVLFRKLEDGLCDLAGLNKLVFVSIGTGDCSGTQHHSSQVSVRRCNLQQARRCSAIS